jgi:signal peptidase I
LLVLSASFALVSVLLFIQKADWNYRYEILRIASSTMRPALEVNDIIIVEKTNNPNQIYAAVAPEGDIVLFHKPNDPDELIVHRAVEKVQIGATWYFQTKGDNNVVPDYWVGDDTNNGWISEQYVVGKVSEINPPLYAILFATNMLMWWCIGVSIVSGMGCVLVFTLTRTKMRHTQVLSTRICPACRKDLSNLPDDISVCPYCGTAFKT